VGRGSLRLAGKIGPPPAAALGGPRRRAKQDVPKANPMAPENGSKPKLTARAA